MTISSLQFVLESDTRLVLLPSGDLLLPRSVSPSLVPHDELAIAAINYFQAVTIESPYFTPKARRRLKRIGKSAGIEVWSYSNRAQ